MSKRNVDLVTGDLVYKTILLTGYDGSNYESHIWQEMARLDAVSTVRGLQFAREAGIEVINNLTSANWATESPKFTSNTDASMNYSAGTVSAIKSYYIDQGFTLTIPRSKLQYDNWKGIIFIAQRNDIPAGGGATASYIISGGYSGGYTTGLPFAINTNSALDSTVYNFLPEVFGPIIQDITSPLNNTTAANGNNTTVSFAGDPVNMVTGNLYHTERDIALKGRGGLPIVFERSYNSRSPQDGPLGFGWTHSFNHFLRFYGVEGSSPALAKVSWNDGSGGEKFFATTAHTDGNISLNINFPHPAGVFATLSRQPDGTYTIREKNGLIYHFDAVNGTATNSGIKARLLSIEDRNGNTLSLSYAPTTGCTGGSLLCKVSDGLGRSLSFTYTGTHITEITDWTNRRFQYGYDANGNLNNFKNPLAVAGSQGAVLYSYFSASAGVNLNHALQSYTLPNGNAMGFEYYMNGKVFRHTTQPLKQTNTFTYNDFRRENTQINERGHTRRFFFDANGNPVKIIAENGAVNTYTYDPANPFNRLSQTDPQGNVTQYAYDDNGNVREITTPRGATVSFSDFTVFNQPQRIKDARGNYTVLKYDGNGNFTQELKLKAGFTPTIPYTPVSTQLAAWKIHTSDVYGNLTSTKRLSDFDTGLGLTLNFNYESTRLNMTSVSRVGDKNGDGTLDAADISPTLVYNTRGQPTTDIDADWQIINKEYDSVDRITKMTDAVGQPRDYRYDANGNPTDQSLTSNSALLDRQSARYDSADRKVASIDAGGNVTQYGYDAIGNVTSITNADNYRISLQYDEANRVSKAFDALGRAVTTTRDAEGKPRSVTDPNGNTVTYDYWDNTRDGRLKRITQPKIQSFSQGRATEYDYDANGNVIKSTDYPADGSGARITLTTYDELNRPIRVVGPAYTDATSGSNIRPVTKYTYGVLVNAVVKIMAGRTDTSGTNPASDVVTTQQTIGYDYFSRKIRETDALNKSWRWTYDINNNVISQTDAKDQVTTFTWGYGHQLLSQSAGSGASANTTRYSRNALGQVLVAQNPEVTYSYSYDNAHRLKTIIDNRGNKTLTYQWSPGGLLNSMTDNDNRQTTYQYDAAGRLNGIIAPNGDKFGFTVDAGGRITQKWLPNGTSARYQYNADNSLKQLVNRANNAILTQHDYIYDGAGNRQSQTEKIGAITTNYSYVYDPLGRLKKVSNGNAAQEEGYAYDEYGNRTKKILGNPVTAANTYVYNFDSTDKTRLLEMRQGTSSGALLRSFVYDANGNITKKCEGGTVTRTTTDCTGATTSNFIYNALNQLVTASKTGIGTQSYGYDDQGRRVRKSGVGTQYMQYDGDNVYAKYALAPSTATQPAAVYVFAGTDNIITGNAVSGPKTYSGAAYHHKDGLGSIVATSNNLNTTTATQRFDAWGNKLSETASIYNYGYTGREPDETGLVYYRARYYDPVVGRFTQRDPSGMPDGINQYAYVANNPTNYIDPWGLLASKPGWDQGFYNYFTGKTGTSTGSQNLSTMAHSDEVLSDASPDTYDFSNGPVYVASRTGGNGTGGGGPPMTPLQMMIMKEEARIGAQAAGKITNETGRFINGVKVVDQKTGNIFQGTVDLSPTLNRINSGSSFPHRNDGSIFKNKAGDLPQKPDGYYKEYVHPTPGISGPGPQRIVTGQGGEVYYTPDHYKTFIPLPK